MDKVDKDFVVPNDNNEDENEDRKFYFLVFIFIITLIILLSTVSFAILNKYVAGTGNNTIDTGSVLFSFNEGGHYINLINTMPTEDSIGKNLSGNNEYFDFDVSVGFDKSKKHNDITYEVSLVPVEGNTVSPDMIRVYLEENGKGVLINGNEVNNFSDLNNSDKRKNGKLLIKQTLDSTMVNSYRFRMWLSDKYKVDSVQRTFKCYVAVDAY